jgi:hypothetical protein
MGHEVNVLWASHVVHHSSEYYNLSTALRQTSSGWLFGWIFYLPMAVAGVPPIMFVTVGLIDLLYQYWVHTELVGRMGWFDRVFVSPSNHRVHHGQNDYCIDKNYGGILIVWDRLFGTFVDEREGEKIHYGIRKPLRSFNPVWGNLHYYADLWRASCVAVGWRAKLGVWLAPPGGWNVPLEHFDGAHFVRYGYGAGPAALVRGAAVRGERAFCDPLHCRGADAAIGAGGGLCAGHSGQQRVPGSLAGRAWLGALGRSRAGGPAGHGLCPGDGLVWFCRTRCLALDSIVVWFGQCVLFAAFRCVRICGGARMNPDALSDLVLLAACAASAWRVAVVRAAWRGAMLLLGLAAAMGVLRYSGLEWALGPHRFFSLLAACVAFG